MTVCSGCRGQEKVCVGAATGLPLHGRRLGCAHCSTAPLCPSAVGTAGKQGHGARRPAELGDGKARGGGRTQHPFPLPPRVFTYGVRSVCPIFPAACPCRVGHRHLQRATVPSDPGPAFCGHCERLFASPSPRLQSRNARGAEQGAAADAKRSDE